MKPIPLDVAWHIFNHSEPHVQSHFARCSHAWHSFFNPKLYRHDVTNGQYSAVFETIAHCTDTRVALATLEHTRRAGADYNKPTTMYMTEAQQPSPFLVTALYLAASKGYAEIVSFLLDHGADIDGVPDCRLRTPVFLSLLSRDAETSMVLLRRGARLESPEFGINALHQAVAAGLTEVITYLIDERGLGVDQVDSNGDTPLIHSLLSPSPETVIAHLARFGADVNQPTTIDTWRMTPLSMACEDGMFSAALSLLEAGADATGESDGLVEGADPALRIYDQKPLELALLARSKQTNGRTAAVKERLIKRLVKSGADPYLDTLHVPRRPRYGVDLVAAWCQDGRRSVVHRHRQAGAAGGCARPLGCDQSPDARAQAVEDLPCVVFALLLGGIKKRRCGGNAISAGFAEVHRAYGYGDAKTRDQSE
ncbi:fibronectin type 3 and ankyrin repeat domains 1 protein [Colletotrichum spaethianum]|uniref:Fibronectin type 3 and ankyrin repeat domains 1 protein n=1 Tax=Colletotrichum spaethianum TaxID=700344 RepID=A0AA37PDX2_9PEZI|nr:fibronectin type 3 and ankyrin repeat domains 1 protein [Colletotrichum spaethianum]GKT50510.1 fibronectin type 3 and ankyrin repeat domains 1 protein [Colletotrichum spaethianum]